MKTAKLGDFLLWEGKPAKIIGTCDRPTVLIEVLEDKKCPHCGGSLGHEQLDVVVTSPNFQNGAEQVQTITL